MVVGSVEIEPVADAVGLLCDYVEAYPGVVVADWEPYRELYPTLFAGDAWRLPCVSYLIRSEGVTILVDTGVGPPGLWDWTAEEEGHLPAQLDAHGVRLDEIDVVFLTHLHIDHLGWNTDLEGAPLFPRARYVVHAAALEYALRRPDRPHIRRCVVPLADSFELVDAEAELAPGVIGFEAPGHYPGHMGLRISSGGEQAMLVADVMPHPEVIDRPEWVLAFDELEPTATRAQLIKEIVDNDRLVVCGHYPGSGIGRVVARDGRVLWDETR